MVSLPPTPVDSVALQNRLKALANYSSKGKGWLKADLSIEKSSFLGRLLWKVIGLFSTALQQRLYGVNLVQSQETLQTIREKLMDMNRIPEQLCDTFNAAAHQFTKLFPKYEVTPIPLSSLSSLPDIKKMMEEMESKWDPQINDYRKLSLVNEAQFGHALKLFTEQCKVPRYEASQAFGYATKEVVPSSTCIFQHADLHGDLRTLEVFLNTLKKEGALDDNYRLRRDVRLVFLGDYADRGKYSMEVLAVLMQLTLANPQQVTLLRGNHEDAELNCGYTHPQDQLRSFLCTPLRGKRQRHCNLLDRFYKTLPLAHFIAQEHAGKQEYVAFVHGAVEPSTDLGPWLDDRNDSTCLLPKWGNVSQRVQQLLHDQQITSSQKASIQRLLAIEEQEKQEVRKGSRETALTAWNWGDIGDTRLSSLGRRRWALSPQDLKHYFKATRTEQSEVKAVFRGHQHQHEEHTIASRKGGQKVMVVTLPAGMSPQSPFLERFVDQPGRACILQTASKSKNWKKTPLLLETASDPHMKRGDTVTLHAPSPQ